MLLGTIRFEVEGQGDGAGKKINGTFYNTVKLLGGVFLKIKNMSYWRWCEFEFSSFSDAEM